MSDRVPGAGTYRSNPSLYREDGPENFSVQMPRNTGLALAQKAWKRSEYARLYSRPLGAGYTNRRSVSMVVALILRLRLQSPDHPKCS